MKIILLLLSLSLLGSCSSKKENSITSLISGGEENALQPLSIEASEGFVMGGVAPSLTIDNPESNQANFGAIVKNSGISTYSYIVSNPSYGTALKGGSILIDASTLSSPYSLKCYNGLTELATVIPCGSITLKKGASARVTIQLDSSIVEGEIASQVLRINDYPITVNASIVGAPAASSVTVGTHALSFDNVDPRIASANQIINVQTTSKLKAVSIASPVLGALGSKGFKIITNSCLVPFKGSCQITVGFDGSSSTYGAVITDTMTVNNEAIALSASTIIPPSSKLIPVIGVSDLVNLGTIYMDGAMPTVPALKFKVTSLSASYGEYVTGVTSDSEALSVSQSCPAPMTKATECLVTASLNASKLSPGKLSVKVSLQSTNGVSREAVVTMSIVQTGISAQLLATSQIESIASTGATRIVINNTGTTSLNPALTVPSPLMIQSTTCLASLLAGSSCYYDLIIDPSKKANLLGLTASISIASPAVTLEVKAGANTPSGEISCAQGYIPSNDVCIANAPETPVLNYVMLSNMNRTDVIEGDMSCYISLSDSSYAQMKQGWSGSFVYSQLYPDFLCNSTYYQIDFSTYTSFVESDGSVSCFDGNYNAQEVFNMSANSFDQALGGNCANILSSFETLQALSFEQTYKYLGTNASTMVAIGNNLYFKSSLGGKLGDVLSTISLNSNQSLNTNLTPTIIPSISPNRLFKLGSKLVNVDTGTIHVIDSANNNSVTSPSVACQSLGSSTACNAYNGEFFDEETSTLYLAYARSNTRYIYKTTDGVNFESMFTGTETANIFINQPVMFGGSIYYRPTGKVIKKFDTVTKLITTVSMSASDLFKIGNTLYGVDNSTGGGRLTRINSAGEILIISQGIPFRTIYAAPTRAILVPNSSPLIAYGVDGSDTVTVINNHIAADSGCYDNANTLSEGVIHPTTNTLFFSCSVIGQISMFKMKISGEVSKVLDAKRIASANPVLAGQNGSIRLDKNNVMFKGSLYLSIGDKYYNYTNMARINDQDELQDFYSSVSNTELDPTKGMIEHQGYLYFSGKLTTDEVNIPTGSTEIYRIFE